MPSSTPIPKSARLVAIGVLALGLVGLADALWLTVEHYRGGIIPCNIVRGCQAVTTSRFATIGPVPVALLGTVYYTMMLILAALAVDRVRPENIRQLFRLSIVGFAFSLYLVSLQAFVIKAFCFYCLISATSSTLIFVLAYLGRRMVKSSQITLNNADR